MPAEGQRRRSVVQATAIAKKRQTSKRGPPPKLDRAAEKACRSVTRHIRSQREKAAVRAAFGATITPAIVSGWIAGAKARLEQDLADGLIDLELYHRRALDLIDQARKLVEGQTRAVPVYDAPPLVAFQINVGGGGSDAGEPKVVSGPGDLLEIG